MVMLAFHPAAGQTPAVNTDAVLSLAAPTNGSRWCIPEIYYSYSGTPTAGELVISWTEGVTTYTENYYIAVAGLDKISYHEARRFPSNTAITVTLKAGGSGVSGTIYAPNAITEM